VITAYFQKAVAMRPSRRTPVKKFLFVRPNFRWTCSCFWPSGLHVRPDGRRDFFFIHPSNL